MIENGKNVCILVIIHKSDPSPYEKISLRQCEAIFKSRDIFFICPEHLQVEQYRNLCPSARFDFIDPSWQMDYGMFNRLKILPFIYNRYKSYRFALFYEPDAFVFRDELDKWCSEAYDYIGAPWFSNFASQEMEGEFIGVGNGGFSLRNIKTHLKVLSTFSYLKSVDKNFGERFIKKETPRNLISNVIGFLLDHSFRNNTHALFNSYNGHEDQFWGLTVAKKFKWFRVPDYAKAAAFAFEMQPHRLYAINKNQLPFGCHAWWKYDLEFWKPHIEKFGYDLASTE